MNTNTRTITIHNETTITVPEYGRSMQMSELQDIVRRSGSHFFDRDTMRYFRSRVDSYTMAGKDGWYFVTSEQHQVPPTSYGSGRTYPRLYTVRCLRLENYDGTPGIELYELGEFQAFKTLNRARKAAKYAAQHGAAVCTDCRIRLAFTKETVCSECQTRAARREAAGA